MHIKQKAADFKVEELTNVHGGSVGDFAFYRLDKQGWTTPDALQIIRRRWKLEVRRVSVGGLKDRHAETTQYLTIYRGPQRKLTHANLRLTYLGQVAEPYTSEQIEANRFAIVIRKMTVEQVGLALSSLEEVRQAGVPNYYDDQRFGSAAHSDAFIAKEIILGNFEAALKLALTAPYAFQRSAQKKEKTMLRQHWGNWDYLRDQGPGTRGQESGARHRSKGRGPVSPRPSGGEGLGVRGPRGKSPTLTIIDHLAEHPDDYAGALERLPAELRTLYLSAYQSHLWNHMLIGWLNEHVPGNDLIMVKLRLGEAPMPRRLAPDLRDELRALTLPLHSARNLLADNDPRKPYYDRVLADEGLKLEQFKLKSFRKLFFSKGDRSAWCFPRDPRAESASDEEHVRKKKLTLRFDLPRGSYATLVVKRITRGILGEDSTMPTG
jgi:tRNA pseudouridine13 synthase